MRALTSIEIIKFELKKFNAEFDSRPVNIITADDLKNYQAKLQRQGFKPGTVDQDLGKVKAMVNAAFLSGKVGADAYRAFKAIKKTLVKGSDVRDRVLISGDLEVYICHDIKFSRVRYFFSLPSQT